MKQLILSHETALNIIRQYRIIPDEIQLPEKLDILVSQRQNMHINSKLKFHLASFKFPNKSIFAIDDNHFCVCPELLLIQLSSKLSFEQLFLLTLEICGTYSIDPSTKIFMPQLSSISSIDKIENYYKRYSKLNPKTHGIANLKSVIKYAEENSASPMESRLYIKLCGPASKGFYGCKNLKMNIPIQLSHYAEKIAGQHVVIPDICSVKHKVAIEYDSAQYHENTIQGQKDKRRRDALVHDGWEIYTFVPAQVNNVETFDIIARQILKSLNQDNRLRIKNFERKRNRNFILLR